MTLQRKFSVLLGALGLAVLANLGTALWTIAFLEDLARPWGEIQQVQNGLNALKASATRQARIWAPGFPLATGSPALPETVPARERFEQESASIKKTMADLEAIGAYRVRVGKSTGMNLTQRLAAAQDLGRAWLGSPTPAGAEAAAAEYYKLNGLIERIDNSIIEQGYFEARYGQSVRSSLLIVLGSSLLGTVMAGVLGVVLLRRWVVRPIGVLRQAAVQLAQGDFSHRVPVQGSDELGMLSAEVNHMAGMISAMQEERVDRERLAAVGEMVRRLAHNLRNPLAGIRSLAEVTRAELPPGSPAIETQDRIVSTVDRFERWLSDLLSATTPLSLAPQTIGVESWLRTVIEPLRPMASERGVGISVDAGTAPAQARFDARHLEQAVVAVVTNAIQASPRNRGVTVAAAPCEDGQSWQIQVTDEGPGVPEGLVDKVFRPYFTTKRDGTGIGLAVAKQIVEQHGGRIWVETASKGLSEGSAGEKRGSGARFVMRLPLASVDGEGSKLANTGHPGADVGANSDRRGRGEPSVLNPADAAAGRT